MSHYYSKTPDSARSDDIYEASVKGVSATFVSGSGVFCIGKLDFGSAVLIEYAQIPEESSILDLGCGYGPVGIFTKLLHPTTTISFTDVNERAVAYAKQNCRKNRVKYKSLVCGDGFESVPASFDVILLNPPQSAGKDVCDSLIKESANHLNENGSLHVVVRKNKGGNIIIAMLENYFDNYEVLAKKGGFWVIKSIKK
ncbi:MAG: 16S rRNA (guanine1207-N2)-methyltransferase [Candidatus Woesearchaeota archaeon]|jgi:16S rRNA (guanine1207-N2)-methyltransferase